MSVEKNLPYLQTDLILEILSRLPAKSIARFRCVSKLWAFTISSRNFTELFLTQSKTRPPRFLFAIRGNEDEWCLYSFPQPQFSYKNTESSLSVTAEFHMRLTKAWFLHISPSISGFIYFSNMPHSNTPILCNPSSGHLFLVPHTTKSVHSFFGYDPIDKQFSVSAICRLVHRVLPSSYQILKFGSETLSWRNIECPLHHYPLQTNICINGILYYIASFGIEYHHKIVCFHLNSEKFNCVDVPYLHEPHLHEPDKLVNFKGKLGVINMKEVLNSEKKFNLELILWVLEDIKKQKWSKHSYVLMSRSRNTNFPDFSIVGVTDVGEVVLSLCYTTNPLQVYFFNLEKNILRKVEIKGFDFFNHHSFCGCVDYVEELRALKWS